MCDTLLHRRQKSQDFAPKTEEYCPLSPRRSGRDVLCCVVFEKLDCFMSKDPLKGHQPDKHKATMWRCVILSTLLGDTNVPGLFLTVGAQLLISLKQNTGRWASAADVHVTPPNVFFNSGGFQFSPRVCRLEGKASEPRNLKFLQLQHTNQPGLVMLSGALKSITLGLRLDATSLSKVYFCVLRYNSASY